MEVLVRTNRAALARRIAAGLSAHHRAGLVVHSPSASCRAWADGEPDLARAEGVPVVLGANGRECILVQEGHFDLLQQRTLLSDLDLVVVSGPLESSGPTVLDLEGEDPDLSDASAQVVACTGARPLRVPPGGLPWFPPGEEDGIVEVLLERLSTLGRSRPVWALLVGGGEVPADLLSTLSGNCARWFHPNPSVLPGAEAVDSRWPDCEGMGDILELQGMDSGASILRIDQDRPGCAAAAERLLLGREPMRVATALRHPDTHLPDSALSIWEPRSRARILQGLATGITCPDRILAHSTVHLLDP